MHLVECWETRGKMEEDERETGKMISGVPPPLARPRRWVSRSVGKTERAKACNATLWRNNATGGAAARNSFSPFCEL